MEPWIWLTSGWVLAALCVLFVWLVVLPMAAVQDWLRRRYPMTASIRARWRGRVNAFNKVFIVGYVVVMAVIVLLAVLTQMGVVH
jgi:hypothetical protein